MCESNGLFNSTTTLIEGFVERRARSSKELREVDGINWYLRNRTLTEISDRRKLRNWRAKNTMTRVPHCKKKREGEGGRRFRFVQWEGRDKFNRKKVFMETKNACWRMHFFSFQEPQKALTGELYREQWSRVFYIAAFARITSKSAMNFTYSSDCLFSNWNETTSAFRVYTYCCNEYTRKLSPAFLLSASDARTRCIYRYCTSVWMEPARSSLNLDTTMLNHFDIGHSAGSLARICTIDHFL